MNGPFTRNCAKVTNVETQECCLAPVSSSISEVGHESMWCGNGHKVKEWYVLDCEKLKIALAKLNSSPQILDVEMMLRLSIDPMFRPIHAPAPSRQCKRGHNDWYMDTDEKYRCRQCKKERYVRIRKEKGRKERKPRIGSEEVRRRNRKKLKERYQKDPEFRKRRNASSRKYWDKKRAKKEVK